MKKNTRKALVLAASALLIVSCAKPTAQSIPTQGKAAEMTAAGRWAAELGAKTTGEKATAAEGLLAAMKPLGTLFSFTYGERPSAEFLAQWKQTSDSSTGPDGRTILTRTYTDPATGLEVRTEAVVFADFPAVEWVMHFKNTGTADTPILENILPLDSELSLAGRTSPRQGGS